METTLVYVGYIGIMEDKMETTLVYICHKGIMEYKMETTLVYMGFVLMDNKMESTI